MRRLLTAHALLIGCLTAGGAEDPCARCHPAEAYAFARSAMGRSVGPPPAVAHGRIVQKSSGSMITIRWRGSQLEHKLEWRGIVADYPVAYAVGAGVVGHSYIVRLGKYLFQSPASYYTRTKS